MVTSADASTDSTSVRYRNWRPRRRNPRELEDGSDGEEDEAERDLAQHLQRQQVLGRDPAQNGRPERNAGQDVAGDLRYPQDLDQVPGQQREQEDQAERRQFIHTWGCAPNPRQALAWKIHEAPGLSRDTKASVCLNAVGDRRFRHNGGSCVTDPTIAQSVETILGRLRWMSRDQPDGPALARGGPQGWPARSCCAAGCCGGRPRWRAAPQEPAGAEPRQVAPPAPGLQPVGPVIDGPPAPLPPATITRDTRGGATVRAVRLAEPLQLDGVLDEPIYARVEPFGGFIQQAPDEGRPATERTDNWIFFDDESIYVGARSPRGGARVGMGRQRDAARFVPAHQQRRLHRRARQPSTTRRNGFAFRVNPIGGFSDRQITDEGNPNRDWNPVWDVRTGRFDGGWTVEMEIPFQSLRFRPGADQVWGIQLGRDIRSNFEEVYLTAVPISAGPGAVPGVGAAGSLVGLEVPAGQPHARDQALRDRLAQHRPDGRAADLERRRRERRRRRQVRPHGEP